MKNAPRQHEGGDKINGDGLNITPQSTPPGKEGWHYGVVIVPWQPLSPHYFPINAKKKAHQAWLNGQTQESQSIDRNSIGKKRAVDYSTTARRYPIGVAMTGIPQYGNDEFINQPHPSVRLISNG
ncbi:hypothetical protein [Brenneria goodwinii]|uniref:hypothetical protein n=1 Tax=Brenneria goodwinii TaxID=1109412 RepID=UPI00065E0C36|nr:hypothetical protein [Brenneria goodwinii]